MLKKSFLIVSALFGGISAYGQISFVQPQQPSATDIITVTYKADTPGATLTANDSVFVRVTSYLENGAVSKFHLKMIPNGQVLTRQFKLTPFTSSFKAEFYTLNRDDDKAALQCLVYDSKNHIPVKGAYLDDMFTDPENALTKEISNYPDNYLAYAKYFNVVGMMKDADKAAAEISPLLARLYTAAASGSAVSDNAGLLTALCIGNAKAGMLNKAKPYLVALLTRHPTSAETAFAFSIYNYEYYKLSNKEVEEDIRQELKKILIAHPEAEISKDENVFHYLQKQMDITVGQFEKVLMPMYKDSSISYHGFTNLPEIYLERNEKLDEAELQLNSAVNQFNTGNINHQYRLNYGHYQLYVPYILLDLVKVDLLKKEYGKAVVNAGAALNILVGSNTEGNFMPELLRLRADAYRRLGNFNLAMEDYKRLYNNGDKGIADSMRIIFSRCNLKSRSFEDFVSSIQNKKSSNKRVADQAINFTAKDLRGNAVSLSDFKGKLVVLNIWGIGCGPCIAEMPELNELVKAYENKDVVFLGITGDKTESLLKFLKKKPYKYKILNGLKNITETFNTNSLPVHMIFGKNGEVISRSIGARPDIKNYLQQLIDQHL